MRSKTSLFNLAVFKKDVTRLAPLWGLYLLCLILGMLSMYMNNGQQYWFANRMAGNMNSMALVNLVYSILTAVLLFSDLFNSRMSGGLHAMPLRRETWFVTHALAGLAFSFVPTLVTSLVCVPLLENTCVVNAWAIAPLWLLVVNLQFVCLFGIALLCVQCAGNWLAAGMLHALINGGTYLCYAVVDLIYTPMLYGVVTPTRLMWMLTPCWNLAENPYVEMDSYYDLRKQYQGREEEMVANFQVNWAAVQGLLPMVLVGLLFALGAVLLYRRRKLECAGDLLAYPVLEPVVRIAWVLAAVFFAKGLVDAVYYGEEPWLEYLFLAVAVPLGYFAAEMIIQRTTRAFRPKVWARFAMVVAVAAVSLTLTKMDVFSIAQWIPRQEQVVNVELWDYSVSQCALTERADIQTILRLHQLALADPHPDGEARVRVDENGNVLDSDLSTQTPDSYRWVGVFYLEYQLTNGRTVNREYAVWADEEAGDIVREYLSRWEIISDSYTLLLNHVREGGDARDLYIYGSETEDVPQEALTNKALQELLDAVRADCDQGNMAQNSVWHQGYFRDLVQEESARGEQTEIAYEKSIGINVEFGQDYQWINVYPDSQNVLNWMRQYGLLTYEVIL